MVKMDIYKTQFAEKFFPKLILRDILANINDKITYPDPQVLSMNEYWLNLFFYNENNDQYIFKYSSYNNSLSDIEKMLDIIHGLNVSTSIQEDIKLAILLDKYAPLNIFEKFINEKKINKDIINDDIYELYEEELIMKYVNPSRWEEANIVNPLIFSPNDIYVRVHWDNDKRYGYSELDAYINYRTIGQYLKEEYYNEYDYNELTKRPTQDEIMQYDYIVHDTLEDFIKDMGNHVISKNLLTDEGIEILEEYIPDYREKYLDGDDREEYYLSDYEEYYEEEDDQ